MNKKTFQFFNQVLDLITNDDDANAPNVVMLYDAIGKDPWDGGKGISAQDIRNVLAEAPKNKDLHVRINSKGGDVHEGMAIRNAFDEWPKGISGTIDGVAASTSSWILPKRAKIKAFKNSQVFIHDAIGFAAGNEDEVRSLADKLGKTSNQIAGMYAERTGKRATTMRSMMRGETLLTGEEAKDLGLVDEIIDGEAIRNFLPEELDSMKNRIRAIYNSVAKPAPANNKTQIMNRDQMLALLQENGASIANTATDEQLQAALKELLKTKKVNAAAATDPADVSALKAEVLALKNASLSMTNALNEAKRIRITSVINELSTNDQLPVALKEKALARAMIDETYIDELRAMPAKRPGAEPLSAPTVELVSESFGDVQNFVLNNGPRFTDKFFGKGATHATSPEIAKEISARALKVGNAIGKHKAKILEMWNSNAIDSALSRQVILQDMVEAYAIAIARFDVFSVVYNQVPLQGTDVIAVPYFPLQATASTSFVSGTGYTTASDWTENSRSITVGGDGNSANSGANAAVNTAKDRKFQMISFRSYDLARLPYLNASKLFQQAANKLGVDIFTDVVSKVVTKANFSTALPYVVAAGAFTADSVADLREWATGQAWPQAGRCLVIDHTRYTSLIKDPSFKAAYAYGTNDAIKSGRIPMAYGFEEIMEVPNLGSYSPAGENLIGWVNHKSAVLVATSPIMPTEEVRSLLTRYDVIVDPKTGAAFEYRRMGNAVTDTTSDIVECSYGAAKGVDAALGRMNGA
jgi:ATP-dependent protease ClpP protease subunit